MKTFLSLIPILAFFTINSALANVKVAEDSIDDLKDFEDWRANQCVEAQADWQQSSKNAKNRKVKEIADALDAWCPMDGSVMYVTPAIEDACEKDKRQLTELCRKFDRIAQDANANEAVFFTPTFDELMLFTQEVPWKTVPLQNEIANLVGVTVAQRGNLSVEITAELIALDMAEYSNAEIAAFQSYLDGLDLNLSQEGILYVPFMAIRLYALGLTDKEVYLDIASIMDKDGHKPINLAGEDERIGGAEPFNYFLPLSAGNISHFNSRHAIRITGYENRKRTKPLYQFTLPMEGFATVMEELLTHYKSLQNAGQ